MNELMTFCIVHCAYVCICTCCSGHYLWLYLLYMFIHVFWQSALHAAAVHNKLLFTELLLDHGADVEALDAGGLRPIDLAAKNKCSDCVMAITNKLGLSLIIL